MPKLAAPGVAGIIIGTPVYFGNMSSLCKAFLDRCIVFHKDKRLPTRWGACSRWAARGTAVRN